MSDRPPSRSAPPGSGPAVPTPPPKQRNPVERILVWGLIIVMVGLVSVEAFSKFSYDATLAKLDDENDKADKAGEPLVADDVEKLISGMPSVTKKEIPVEGSIPDETITYQWWSLFKTYRIEVYFSQIEEDGPLVVTRFETEAPPEGEEPAPQSTDAVAGDDSGESPPNTPAGMPGGMVMTPAGDGGGAPSGGHSQSGPPQSGAGRPEPETDEDEADEDSEDADSDADADSEETDADDAPADDAESEPQESGSEETEADVTAEEDAESGESVSDEPDPPADETSSEEDATDEDSAVEEDVLEEDQL